MPCFYRAGALAALTAELGAEAGAAAGGEAGTDTVEGMYSGPFCPQPALAAMSNNNTPVRSNALAPVLKLKMLK